MNAKKLFSTLACTLFLTVGATQASASLLQDWTYTYGDVKFTLATEEYEAPITGWYSGNYFNQMLLAPVEDSKSGTMQLPTDNTTDSKTYNGSASPAGYFDFFTQSTMFYETNVMGPELIGTLSFSYSASAVDGPVSFSVSEYAVKLYAYSDGINSYVYYNTNETSTTGGGSVSYNGYEYGITGMGLHIDGKSLELDDQGNSYWIINEDTRAHIFEDYVLGSNSNVIESDKTQIDGLSYFNLSGSFSVTATTDTETAPTPEPATLLLTGLGLAGLGAIKRRRNKAA